MKKKLTCLLLALCMVLALTACGEPKLTSADFEGTWKASVDISKDVADAYSQEDLDEAFDGIDSSAYINIADLKIPEVTIVMQLNADKSFTMVMDESCKQIIADAVVAWFTGADFEGLFTELLTKECEDYGMTMDDMMALVGAESVTEMIETIFEMSLDDYVKELAEEITSDMDDFDLKEFTASGTWDFSPEKVTLTVSDGIDELAFNKDAYTLTESVDGYGDVVFKRQ